MAGSDGGARPRANDRATTVVLLVRHGVTPATGRVLPGRAPGLHLADPGRRQAMSVAERVGHLANVAAYYASPLARARETAAPIAQRRRLAVRVEPGLNECDFGEWTGAELKQLRKRPEWRVVQRHPSGFRFPRGESFMEMQTRITSAVARLVVRHRGDTVVAVSHADPIKAAAAHALGMHLDFFQRLAIAPASITVIAYGAEGPSVLAINSVDGDLRGLGIR